jgi:hypothetical protein
MGMDVIGRKPTTKQGEYFRNSIWWWHPLASYICVVAPAIADHCEHWQTNDGDGLNAEDSAALADKLQEEIDSGRTERFAVIHAAEQEKAPNEVCELCGGTGIVRRPAIGECGTGDMLTGIQCKACGCNEPCDFCKRNGTLRPPAAGECGAGDMLAGIRCIMCDGNGFVPGIDYPFAVDNVRDFVAFLRGCGGFEIW